MTRDIYNTLLSQLIHLLEASKPPEGAGAVVAGSGTAGTTGTGGVGAVREPRASKPDSRRSPCIKAGAGANAGARAGAAVGARVGDIRPDARGGNRQDCNCDIICSTVQTHPDKCTFIMITDTTHGR